MLLHEIVELGYLMLEFIYRGKGNLMNIVAKWVILSLKTIWLTEYKLQK